MGAPISTHGRIKTIGANGQISLGKHLAGRQVLVEEPEPGVWLIRTATVVPDNERWLQSPQTANDLERALADYAIQARDSLSGWQFHTATDHLARPRRHLR